MPAGSAGPEPEGFPLPPGSRGSTEPIHDHLRGRILTGDLEAGSELAQAQVAKEYGVSRGPVREVFRLLQREGLIEAEVNRKARIAELSLADVEHVYALRVVNEALALAVSVPRFTDAELGDLDRLATAVQESAGHGFGEWEQQHGRFHALLVAHAGERMTRSIDQWVEHSER
ncbi:MAG: GntR family transcriptional regulator, partial [Kineosporiaceae bacterium]